jgi:hypothetical protein
MRTAKLYDKFGLILRIETTVDDLTFFKHCRKVEHRDSTCETKWTSMITIYNLSALRQLLSVTNRRYLELADSRYKCNISKVGDSCIWH